MIDKSSTVCDKQDRTMTWSNEQVWFMLKKILNYHDWSDQVSSMTKIRKENNIIDCAGAVYLKNDTKVLWLIKLSTYCDCDEN